MKLQPIFLSAILMLLSTMMIIPTLSTVQARPPPLVCITTPGTKCSTTPVQLTGAAGTKMTVWVAVHASLINGFDVIVIADNRYIVPISEDLSASIFGTTGSDPGVIIKECVGGVDAIGAGCAPQDNPNTAHMAVGAQSLTGHHTVGDLYEITYDIVAVPPAPIPVTFQIGCPLSSVSGSTQCVLITSGPTLVNAVSVDATFI